MFMPFWGSFKITLLVLSIICLIITCSQDDGGMAGSALHAGLSSPGPDLRAAYSSLSIP
jgi:hypothetical protein